MIRSAPEKNRSPKTNDRLSTPQLEGGYTQISNQIMEDWSRINLSEYQWSVLHHIIRFTYGYNLKVNKISVNHIAQGTGIHQPNVSRALKELTSMNIITRKGKLRGYNKNSKTWKITMREVKYISSDILQDPNGGSQAQNISPEISNKKVSKNISPEIYKYITSDIKNISPERPNKDNIKKTYKYNKKVIEQIFNFYAKTNSSAEKLLPARKIKIADRLKTFSKEEIERAITNCFNDPFYQGDNDRNWKANSDYIFRNDEILDRLLNLKGNSPTTAVPKDKPVTSKPTHKQIMGLANALSDRQIRREKGEKV